MNLIVTVPASASRSDILLSDHQSLSALNGVSHDEVFSEYFIDHQDSRLNGADLAGGTLTIRYDPARGKLQARVSYEAKRRLNQDESDALVKYTLEQLMDGIGENFSQFYDTENGIFIHFSDKSDEVNLEYEEAS